MGCVEGSVLVAMADAVGTTEPVARGEAETERVTETGEVPGAPVAGLVAVAVAVKVDTALCVAVAVALGVAVPVGVG